MVNYLTTQIKLLIAMLAIILPFSVAQAEDKEDEMTGSQGWYAGVSAQEQLCMGKRYQTGSHPLER